MTIAQIGPAKLDIELPRGNDIALVFRLRAAEAPIDLGSDQFSMAVRWGSSSLVKASADGGLSLLPEAGQIRCPFTAAETKSFPEGKVARYELERQGAEGQRTYLTGHFIATGGLSDD